MNTDLDYDSLSDSEFDGYKVNPIIGDVLRKKKKEEAESRRLRWYNRFPKGHVTQFVRDGLLPYLQSCGYKCKIPFEKLVKSIYNWAWCVMRVVTSEYGKYIHYKEPSHNGSDEDFIWFCQQVETETYTKMLYDWQFRQFFDESPIGQRQHYEFISFLWSIVDLDGSKGHEVARQILEEEIDEEANEKKNGEDIQKQVLDKHGF